MEFDEMPYNSGIRGRHPEYGAIFMSNLMTRKECFRRKLFGLSPKHSHFVKQIKAGMMLFLFEFEKRQLHGVFEACSDGRMNIIPDAFTATGKNYPSQVKVRSIWICDPLSEGEFGGAIKENYFTPKKFNFGLSEVQVLKLLQLFSSKKLYVPRPLTKSRNPKVMVLSTTNEAEQVDDRKSNVRDTIIDEYVPAFINTDDEYIPAAITTGSPLPEKVESGSVKYHFGNVPRDGGVFLRNNNEFQNEHNNSFGYSAVATESSLVDITKWDGNKFPSSGWGRSEYRSSAELSSAHSNQFSNYHSEEVKGIPSEGGFPRNDEFQNDYNKPSLVSDYSSLPQRRLGRPVVVLSRKSPEIITRVREQSMTQPSQIHHKMQPRPLSDLSSSKVLYTTYPGRTVASPSLNYPHPLAGEFNPRPLVQKFQPYDGYSNNASSLIMKQPLSLIPEHKSMDANPVLMENAPFSDSACDKKPYRGTIMGMAQAPYCINSDASLEKVQCYGGGLSLSKYSFPVAAPMGTKINTSEHKFPSPCYPSGSNMKPFLDAYSNRVEPEDQLQYEAGQKKTIQSFIGSNMKPFLDSYSNRVEPEDQLQYEAGQKKTTQSYIGSTTSAFKDPFASQVCLSSVDPRSLPPHYEDSVLEHHPEDYQSSDSLYPDPHKARSSVFSRLTPSVEDGYVPEQNSSLGCYEDNDTSASVDDVMEMLHKSHCHWVKSKMPNQWKRKVDDDDEKFGTVHEPKRWVNPKLKALSVAGSTWKAGSSFGGTGQVPQFSQSNSVLNFKRRSETQKKLGGDGITAAGCDASEGDALKGPQKKRKLVRPDFGTSSDSQENLASYHLQATTTAEEISSEIDKIMLPLAADQVDKNLTSFESKSLAIGVEVGQEFTIDNADNSTSRESSLVAQRNECQVNIKMELLPGANEKLVLTDIAN